MQYKLFCLVFLSKFTIFNFASVGKDNSQVGSVKYLRTDGELGLQLKFNT